jgi:phosphohistidine phosphatase
LEGAPCFWPVANLAKLPMDIYLLRHGVAEEGNLGQPDSERALTSEGITKLRDVLSAAHAAGLHPALILTSPYVRARQTAQVAAAELGYRGDILETNVLIPSSQAEAVWDEIRVHRGTSSLLLVSHEPLMSATLAYLLNSPALRVDFKKGAIARLELEGLSAKPRARLQWLLTARLTRQKP